MRNQYGLDKPMWQQYLIWVKGIVTEGKFGYSFAYKQDVGELIAERLPRTIISGAFGPFHLDVLWVVDRHLRCYAQI